MSSRRVFYVHQPVICPECGSKAKRRSLRQIYCSERCSKKARQRDYRYRKAVQKALDVASAVEVQVKPQKSSDVASWGVVPGERLIPPKNTSVSAGSERANSGSSTLISVPVNLVGGSKHRLPGAARLSPELRREIIDTEIGGGGSPAVPSEEDAPAALQRETGAKSTIPTKRKIEGSRTR
jgi:hypothetical protein